MRPRQYMARRGFTLTEMLVVVSIVVLLTALSIPSLIRMGAFGSNKIGNAAREYYEMLRAARLYATTNNVETALVYQTRMVFELANDEFDPLDMVPVVEGYAVCRRLTPAEIQEINDDFLALATPMDTDELVFVPVPESNGRFRPMPQGTCILPELFEVDGTGASTSALNAVYVADPSLVFPSVDAADRVDESGYMRPLRHPYDDFLENVIDDDGDGTINEADEANRLHFEQGGQANREPLDLNPQFPPGAVGTVAAFPAHRFAPSGEMLPLQSIQRFQVRVGMLPDTEISDRFVTYDDTVIYDPLAGPPTDAEPVTIQFHSANLADAPAATETSYKFHDPRRQPPVPVANLFDLEIYIDNHVTLNVYTATGRVEIEPTVELEDLNT